MKLALFFLLFTLSLFTTVAFVARKTDVIGQAQGSSERGPVRMIRFVLVRDGIYPRSMRVDHGLLNIALEDKTGESAGLVIESVQGDQRAKITQITRASQHWRGRALVRLAPGNYVVSDASQPGHTAALVVNP